MTICVVCVAITLLWRVTGSLLQAHAVCGGEVGWSLSEFAVQRAEMPPKHFKVWNYTLVASDEDKCIKWQEEKTEKSPHRARRRLLGQLHRVSKDKDLFDTKYHMKYHLDTQTGAGIIIFKMIPKLWSSTQKLLSTTQICQAKISTWCTNISLYLLAQKKENKMTDIVHPAVY